MIGCTKVDFFSAVSLPDTYEDNVNLRAPKSAKAPKSILAGQ